MIQLFNEDCLETMKRIPDGSIDLMLTDPPYGTTNCDWDKPINLAEMWLEWERILKPNALWVFTASQPFNYDLVPSRRGFFKYELIWNKKMVTNIGHAKRMPLRSHENIIVFGRGSDLTYNPQMRQDVEVPFGKLSNTNSKSISLKEYDEVNFNVGVGYPKSILEFPRPNNLTDGGLHPTQKPVDLFRWLVLTYSNEGETVFDGYSGSGTTAIACIKEKRNFIGSELNKEYYEKAALRIKIEQMQPALF